MNTEHATASTLISICVPTYNRGQRALRLVNETLPKLEPGCELFVVDNGSHAESEAYSEIADLAQSVPEKLTYRRHSHNLGFHGNYLYCLREGRGALAMVISDEDRPNLAFVPLALKMAREQPQVAIIRGGVAPLDAKGVRRNSFQLRDVLFPAGKEALVSYALSNNYFSGTIYNRGILAQHGLITRLDQNLLVHRDYPHLYIEGLACAVADVALCSGISCFEGAPQMVAGSSNPNLYTPPYSVGCRMDQFVAMRNCLYEAVGLLGGSFDAELFGRLYLKLCAKFFRIIAKANGQTYANNFIDVGVTVRAFAYFAIAAMIRIEECAPYKDAMMQEIDRLAREYGG